VLVEEAIDILRAGVAPADVDYVALDAGVVRDRDIWAALNQYPLDANATRLVIVRRAERIRSWDPFIRWMADLRYAQICVIFVSSADDFPRDPEDESLLPYIEMIKDKGRAVRCSRMSPKDVTLYVESQITISPEGMNKLLIQTDGASLEVVNFLRKIKLFGSAATEKTVQALCPVSVSLSYVTCLIERDKPRAFAAAEVIPASEVAKTLGLLESKLHSLDAMYRARRRGLSLANMVQDGIVPVFVAQELTSWVKDYPPEKIRTCMGAVRMADELHTQGVRSDVLTVLTALW
jgi:hypothetical protein